MSVLKHNGKSRCYLQERYLTVLKPVVLSLCMGMAHLSFGVNILVG
jgi:hypothetical protein